MAWLSRDIEKQLERTLDEATEQYPDGRVPADQLVTDSVHRSGRK